MAWTDLTFAYGSTLTSTQMGQLQANFAAMAAGDAGAPTIQQAGIAASAVGQSQLKTTTGEVSHNTSTTTIKTLAGGSYGFYLTAKVSAGGSATISVLGQVTSTTYLTQVSINAASGTGYATQRYVQASPPYNLGDGEIGLFVFGIVDNITGIIESVYTAPDAPWHNNGPTNAHADYYINGVGWRTEDDIEEELIQVADRTIKIPHVIGKRTIEITQDIKQRDMPVIPHPWIGNDIAGKTVVLIDPVSDLAWSLAEMHKQGQSINELLHDGYLEIGNTALVRAGPPGVMVVSAGWKQT